MVFQVRSSCLFFLVAFAKLREVTISFVVSVRLAHWHEIIRFSLNKFSWNLIFWVFYEKSDKETKLRIHNITAKAVLKFGSEAWVLQKREEKRLEAAHMKYLRHLLGITKLDKEKNQCIRGKTGAQNIVKEIKQYQLKWLQHVQRMDTNRIPKQALRCRSKGQRNIGRPKKRWRDQLHFEDQITGNTPNPPWTWCWWW